MKNKTKNAILFLGEVLMNRDDPAFDICYRDAIQQLKLYAVEEYCDSTGKGDDGSLETERMTLRDELHCSASEKLKHI